MFRTYCSRIAAFALATAGIATLQMKSQADNPASWSVSEGTEGEDVFWTSPSAVDVGFPRYGTSFEITRVEAFTFLGGTDVTGQLEALSGTAVSESLPVTLISDAFTDSTTGTSATVNVGIDSSGFGQVAITDVTLGSLLFIQITSIEVDAYLTVEGILPGDFNGDLKVDAIDLELWELSYGVNGGADTDFNEMSDGADFLDWQRYSGSDQSLLAAPTKQVPEPTQWLLAAGLLPALTARKLRNAHSLRT